MSLSNILYAQRLRVVYKYEYKKDSLNRTDVKEEVMFLDINKNKSFFYSYQKFVQDSILKNNFKNYYGNSPINYTNRADITYSVSKKYNLSEKALHLKLAGRQYKIIDDEKLDWQILKEKKKIRNLDVQKAIAYYMGRKWIAWFNMDYVFQDGPYKFDGLPGLILEVYDEKLDHKFSLIGIKKNIKTYFKNNKKEITVSSKKFNSLWHDFKKDPAKNYRNRNKNSGIGYSISMNGISDEREIIKQIDKNIKEKLKKNNNFIDLHLYR